MNMEQVENFTTPHSLPFFPFWEIGIAETWMLIFSFLSVFSTHSYVLWLMVTGRGFSEFFSFSLSVCGIFFSLNCLLILITSCFPFLVLVRLTQFLVGLGITGRPLFQCLICVERYLAVVHPVIFLKYKPLRYRLICCAPAWITVLASCLFCMFLFVLWPFYVYSWYFSTQFLLFISIQLFCLVAVLRALKQSGPGDRKEENHMKRRAFYLILVTTVSLVIEYAPFILMGIVSLFYKTTLQIFWSISYVCFVLTDLFHPVHYLYRTGKLVCFCSCKKLQQ